jgi:hypothetical protein
VTNDKQRYLREAGEALQLARQAAATAVDQAGAAAVAAGQAAADAVDAVLSLHQTPDPDVGTDLRSGPDVDTEPDGDAQN